MTLKEAYDYSVYFLSANGVDEAEFKALCLSCHSVKIKNSEFEMHKNDDVMLKPLADLLWRAKSGEPLQYIIGKWDFYESEFFVGDGVLIPRPETEELVEKVIDSASKIENPVIFDLCAGSGCVGISIAKKCKNATVYCIEKSEKALFYLLKNAEGVENVKIINADINDDIDLPLADIIVSNPPYIKSRDIENLQDEVKKEPRMALDGGADGLDFYKIIANKWKKYLKPTGLLFLEIGEEQGLDVKSILEKDFKNIEIIKDIYKNDRIVKSMIK